MKSPMRFGKIRGLPLLKRGETLDKFFLLQKSAKHIGFIIRPRENTKCSNFASCQYFFMRIFLSRYDFSFSKNAVSGMIPRTSFLPFQ